MIIFIILIQFLVQFEAKAEPEMKFFFHWSNKNRQSMLLGFKNFRKAIAESVYGTGAQGKLSKYAVAGRGLYVAGDAMSSHSYGPMLTIVAVPVTAEIKLYDVSNDYYIIERPESGIRFINADDFTHILETTDTLKKYDFKFMLQLTKAFKRMERDDLSDRIYKRVEVLFGFSMHQYMENLSVYRNKTWKLNYFKFDKHIKVQTRNAMVALQFYDREHLAESLQLQASDNKKISEFQNSGLISKDLYSLLANWSEGAYGSTIHSHSVEALIRQDLYGQAAFDAFRTGLLMVHSTAPFSRMTLDDLQELQRLTYPEKAGEYKGYLMAQIQRAPVRLQTEAQRLLQAGKYAEIYTLLELKRPDGQLRTAPIFISASSQNLDGTRIRFTSEELITLAQNEYLSVNNEKGVVRFNYDAHFAEDARKFISDVFDQAENLRSAYANTKYPKDAQVTAYFEQATELAEHFYHTLISKHLFWDGSGRTSKLARDWLLLYMGLNSPLSTPRNDLTLSRNELLEDLREEIKKSVAVRMKDRLFEDHELVQAALNRATRVNRSEQRSSYESSNAYVSSLKAEAHGKKMKCELLFKK